MHVPCNISNEVITMATYKNEEQYELAIKEYNADPNMTLTLISNKYGIDRGCFSRYMKRHGVEVRQTNKSKTNADRYDKAMKLYEQGYTINQLHEMIGINKKNFSLFLKKQGVNIRGGFENKKYVADENYFEKIDSADKAYWLGFIYADGSVVSKGNTYRLTIELNRIDRLHLEKFLIAIKSNAEIKDRVNRPISSVTINRKKIVDDLIKIGCVPNKTEVGWLDTSVIKGFEKDFLRGYLDGDGYIEKNYKKYRVVYTVKSDNLTNTLVELLSDYGPRIDDCETFNRVIIETKDAFYCLLSDLYSNADTYLLRKYYTCMDRIHAHQSQRSQKTLGK